MKWGYNFYPTDPNLFANFLGVVYGYFYYFQTTSIKEIKLFCFRGSFANERFGSIQLIARNL